MESKQRRHRLASFLSGIYLLAALLLTLGVCGRCCPALEEKMKQAVAGLEDGPVRQAFGTLADGLEEGKPIRQTMTETVQVLFDEEV